MRLISRTILVHYAVLLLCVLPFIGPEVKALCVWAAGWMDLATPGRLLGDLFLTGNEGGRDLPC